MNTDSFITGYKTGKRWKEDYRPGGPYYAKGCMRGENNKACQQCVDDKAKYDDWHTGFDVAYSKKLIQRIK